MALNSLLSNNLYIVLANNIIVVIIFFPAIIGLIQLSIQRLISLTIESRFVISLQILHLLLTLTPVIICVTFKSESLTLVKFFDLINIFDFFLTCDIVLDLLSLIMFFVVVMISFLVSIFARWYMSGDPHIIKFLAFLNFFTFFMLFLVVSNNIVMLFIGWEGIGLFSYFLINFWNTRLNANRSALKAIILNKIGDCFFYLFIFIYYFVFNSFHIYDSKQLCISYQEHENILMNIGLVYFMLFCLLIAAMAKSAQVILHVWLPDAMEGPTPVSALLHAATMVTAGAYVLIKFNWLIFYNESICSFIIFVGIFTNLLASLTALFQHDIKKIIAYSTASQLGLIFITCGMLKFNLAFFHIFNHAFFKALLFILAGIVIHSFVNKQDLRNIFFFKNSDVIFSYVSLIIASLTLIGFPYFSSFYSKDFIINFSFIDIKIDKNLTILFLFLSIITTFLYSFKIIKFLLNKNQSKIYYNFYKKSITSRFNKIITAFFSDSLSIEFVLSILCLFSIFIGFITGTIFFKNYLFFNSNMDIESFFSEKDQNFFHLELPFTVVIFFLVLSISFFIVILQFIPFYSIFTKYWNSFYFLNGKTLFDNLYNYLIRFVLPYDQIRNLDKSIIEKFVITSVILTKNLTVWLVNFNNLMKWRGYLVFMCIIIIDFIWWWLTPSFFYFSVFIFFVYLFCGGLGYALDWPSQNISKDVEKNKITIKKKKLRRLFAKKNGLAKSVKKKRLKKFIKKIHEKSQ